MPGGSESSYHWRGTCGFEGGIREHSWSRTSRRSAHLPLFRHRAAQSDSLLEKHAVAIGIEPVALLDSMAVSSEDVLLAGEGTDKHQEGGFGQMEIGQKRLDDLELVTGIDE